MHRGCARLQGEAGGCGEATRYGERMKRRITTLVIDCKAGDLVEATRFWGAALGREVKKGKPERDKYVELAAPEGEPRVLLQHVAHESRVHLDVDADDVEGEVQRLVGLGAKVVERIKDWVVLEAPTGQRFCVVPWDEAVQQ